MSSITTPTPTPNKITVPLLPDGSIPAQIDEALKLKLKKWAMKKCATEARTFVDCTKDKVFSIPWKCRDSFNDFNDCLARHNTEANLEKVRQKYIEGHYVKKNIDWQNVQLEPHVLEEIEKRVGGPSKKQ
eukprot:GEZU01042715.1.p1 GENE.GEZU01042715.1~~GEZU01042715.1.p1  ORF type:complete len:130 (+),score=32.74 GEZU01042715.1:52-441(+)